MERASGEIAVSLNQSCERGRERIACAVGVLQRRLEWLMAKNERDRVKSSRMNEEIAVSQWLVTLLSGKGPEVHASLLDLARRNRMPQEIDDDDPRYGA